jgi:hypothetical protein
VVDLRIRTSEVLVFMDLGVGWMAVHPPSKTVNGIWFD